MTTTPPKRRSPILYIFLGLIVACLICVGVVAIVIVPGLTKVVNTIAQPLVNTQTFFDDVIKGDYAGAYAQVNTNAQSQFGGSADGLKQTLTTNGMVPTVFAVNNVSVVNNLATVNGTGSFSGAQKYVYVQLQQDGGNWKIMNIQLSDTAPTGTPGISVTP